MDRRQLVARIVEKTGIKLDEDDPAFLLVELNRLILDDERGTAAQQLAEAAQKLNEAATRSVDDFVAVANEALSKFTQRTGELIAAAEKAAAAATGGKAQPVTVASSSPPPAPARASEKKPPGAMLWWLIPLIFAAGVLAGVGLTFLLGK